MPAVPVDMAMILVAAGVRTSYAQLIAAANNMVAGVEVWVQAQQQLEVDSDIPAVAQAICNSRSYDDDIYRNLNLVRRKQEPLLSLEDQ
jgi:hypothetical protein